MSPLDLALRASLVILVALAASAALRRHSAALRHWVLAAGLGSAAAIVPLGLVFPSWNLPVRSLPAADVPASATGSAGFESDERGTPAPPPRMPIDAMVKVVWAIGVGTGATLLFVRFRRLSRLTGRATSVETPRWRELMQELSARHGVRARVLLLKTDAPDVLATWGLRRPCVLLPSHCESWSDARIRIVLSHELAHIRRADWPIQIAADAVRAAFWFNPIVWFACAQLRRESELACDDAVIEAGVPPTDYASQLVEIARTCRPPSSDWAAALPVARPSTLEWRITAMMNPATPHRRPTSRIMALAVAAFVALTIPIATGQVAPQSGPLVLEGSVYDISGAVLPQVAIRLEDASGNPRDAITDASGRFEFDPVEPGVYTIAASLPGFLPLRREVTLRETRQWQRAITLQVATVQERINVRAERTAGAPAAAAAGPLPVGGNIRPPRKLIDVRPEYPTAMRDGGFEGVVPMQVQIATDGSVAFVRVNSAQVHPDLAQAAVDAVSQWKFSPTLLNGAAVEVFMTVTVQFSLQE